MWTTVKRETLAFESLELLQKAIPLNEACSNIILWIPLQPTTSSQVFLLLARIGRHVDCYWTGSSLRDVVCPHVVQCPSEIWGAWQALLWVNITTTLLAAPFYKETPKAQRTSATCPRPHSEWEAEPSVGSKDGKSPKGKVNLRK